MHLTFIFARIYSFINVFCTSIYELLSALFCLCSFDCHSVHFKINKIERKRQKKIVFFKHVAFYYFIMLKPFYSIKKLNKQK